MRTLWPNVVTITALLLGLAGLLASAPSDGSAQRTTLTCDVSNGGSSAPVACR